MNFNWFDLFPLVFTLIILIGVVRLAKSPDKTKFAVGFSTICLLVFLAVDLLIVLNWVDLLDNVNEKINSLKH